MYVWYDLAGFLFMIIASVIAISVLNRCKQWVGATTRSIRMWWESFPITDLRSFATQMRWKSLTDRATYAVKECAVLLVPKRNGKILKRGKLVRRIFLGFAVWKNSSLRIDRYFLGVNLNCKRTRNILNNTQLNSKLNNYKRNEKQ